MKKPAKGGFLHKVLADRLLPVIARLGRFRSLLPTKQPGSQFSKQDTNANDHNKHCQ